MQFQMQYSQPDQFLKVSQLITPFGGTIDMDPVSFGTHSSGANTLIVNIPDANVPAFEKVVTLFELTEYCERLPR